MHNLTKIKLFRVLLCFTYPLALIFIYPFVFFKRRNPTGLFFFFDRYAIGGAQRVHLDILSSVSDIYKQVYFTRKSMNSFLRDEFYKTPNSLCADIHFWCDNLLFRLFTVHYYAFYINKHPKAHIFSSNSTFFYDMLFFINKKHTKTELLHNFTYGNNGMEYFGLGNYKYLTNRMFIDTATPQNVKKQYEEYNIPTIYTKNLHTIENGTVIPDNIIKNYTLPLKVLYAGRGGAQKRIYLINKIAEKCIQAQLPIEFHFAGTMMDELSDHVKQNCIIHGEISEAANMQKLYINSHAILMTSAYEGFPMIIKEGMAHGCIPVVTALDGNKTHLRHKINALLIANPQDEDGVVQQGCELLSMLINNKDEWTGLSASAYQYAKTHFDKKHFVAKYQQFFKAYL